MYTLPNILTLFRIASIPVFMAVFLWPSPNANFVAMLIFLVASLTDLLDGYLARKLNQSSHFGAFLDPVADKLMVAVALVLVAVEFNNVWVTIPAVIMIGREIVISALREWMAELGKRTSVAVSYVGKVKTAMQMFAILVLLTAAPEPVGPLADIGCGLLILSATLTLWTMLVYLRAAWPEFELNNNK